MFTLCDEERLHDIAKKFGMYENTKVEYQKANETYKVTKLSNPNIMITTTIPNKKEKGCCTVETSNYTSNSYVHVYYDITKTRIDLSVYRGGNLTDSILLRNNIQSEEENITTFFNTSLGMSTSPNRIFLLDYNLLSLIQENLVFDDFDLTIHQNYSGYKQESIDGNLIISNFIKYALNFYKVT